MSIVKSVTDIDLSSKSKSDSTISQKQFIASSDTTSEQSHEIVKAETTYQVKVQSWYEPFIPYLVLILLATIIYYFRRKN